MSISVSEQHIKGSRRTEGEWAVLDKRYWPGDSVAEQLDFGLRNEDLDLLVLKRLFEAIPEETVTADDEAAKDVRTQNQSVLVGFRSVYVFDVSQTEGLELPELFSRVSGDVGERMERLLDFIASQDILLEYKESIAPALGMSYGGKIVLLPGQSPAEVLQHSRSRGRTRDVAQEHEAHRYHQGSA